MKIILELLLILSLLGIAIQDFKHRTVYLWFFLVAALLVGFTHYNNVNTIQFLIALLINTTIIIFVISILFLYAKIILKKSFKSTFGLGDFLFFMILAIGFPTITFLLLLSFSLIFSLMLYLVLKKGLKNKTIPLAGLQALFMCLVFSVNWIFNISNLYLI